MKPITVIRPHIQGPTAPAVLDKANLRSSERQRGEGGREDAQHIPTKVGNGAPTPPPGSITEAVIGWLAIAVTFYVLWGIIP